MDKILDSSNGWVVLWPNGGTGPWKWTRRDAMEQIVTEAYWGEAVDTAGYTRDSAFFNALMNDPARDKKIMVAIRKPAIVRKVWRRLRRREGFKIIKVTRIIKDGWATS